MPQSKNINIIKRVNNNNRNSIILHNRSNLFLLKLYIMNNNFMKVEEY